MKFKNIFFLCLYLLTIFCFSSCGVTDGYSSFENSAAGTGGSSLGSGSSSSSTTPVLYLAGGQNAAGVPQTEVYRSTDGITWTDVGDLPSGRSYGGFAQYSGKLYYVGGCTGSINGACATSASVFYSSDSGVTWETSADSLAAVRTGEGLVVFNGAMWLVGGYAGGASTNDDTFSSTSGAWSTNAAVMPGNLGIGAVTTFGGKIWMIGGGIGATNVIYYSTDGITWGTSAGTLSASRARGGLTYYNGYFWYAGGDDLTNAHDDVYKSSDIETWSVVGGGGTLFGNRHSGGMVTLNNKIWYLGGGTVTTGQFTPSDDIYSTNDGITWTDEGSIPAALSGFSLIVAYE